MIIFWAVAFSFYFFINWDLYEEVELWRSFVFLVLLAIFSPVIFLGETAEMLLDLVIPGGIDEN